MLDPSPAITSVHLVATTSVHRLTGCAPSAHHGLIAPHTWSHPIPTHLLAVAQATKLTLYKMRKDEDFNQWKVESSQVRGLISRREWARGKDGNKRGRVSVGKCRLSCRSTQAEQSATPTHTARAWDSSGRSCSAVGFRGNWRATKRSVLETIA